MVVFFAGGGEEFEGLAEEIASDRGERVVRSLDDVRGETICVTHPTALSEDVALSLQDRLLSEGPTTGRFGIITGLTVDAARDLYYRDEGGSGAHGILVPQEDRSLSNSDPAARTLTREDATVENLAGLQEDGLESLSVAISSLSIHAYLSEGLICGVPTDHDVEAFEPPYPPCVTGGDIDCPYDADLFHADQLSVEHAFVSACLSMLPGNDPEGLPVHVGMGLLENARSLIGAYRPVEIRTCQPLLHYGLLRAGYDAAERCYLLERQSHALDIDRHPFLVFGRPDATVAEPLTGDYDVDVSPGNPVTIALADVDARVVDVTVPGEYVDGDDVLLVRNVSAEHASRPLHYVAFEEDGDVRVLVYGPDRLDVTSLRLELTSGSPERREFDRLHASLDNLDGLLSAGLFGGDLRGNRNNLRNHLSGFAPYFRRERSRANAYRDTRERLDRAAENAVHARETIRVGLESRGSGLLVDEYAPKCLSADVRAGRTDCDYCGRPVFDKVLEVTTGDATRIRGMCPHCVSIYDVPMVGDGFEYPTIAGNAKLGADSDGTVEVAFENPLDARMEAHCFPWFCSPEDDLHGIPLFEPEAVTRTLDAGESMRVSFSVERLPRSPESHYTLYAYVLGNLDVYLGMRTVHLPAQRSG